MIGKVHDEINGNLKDFIRRQHVFFVGTAPDAPDDHLNISPKVMDTFRILGPKSVAYLDLRGSGIETVAHLRQNGRITIMFCAFEGRPLILRLYGRGREVIRRSERTGLRRMVLDTLPEMARAVALYGEYGFVETAPLLVNPIERMSFLEKSLLARQLGVLVRWKRN